MAAVAVLALTGIGSSDRVSMADEPVATDLLKRADATIVCADPARAIDSPAAFGDGDPATAVEIPAQPDQDIDLLVSWGGATATIQRIVIGLDPDRPTSHPTDLEVLVSSAAAGEQFTAVKSVALFGGAGPYQYDVTPVAAARVIIRLRAPASGTGVRFTELALIGREGAARPRSAFKESPAKANDVILQLERLSLDLSVPPDEAAMLADGADGRFDDITFAEAALIASGVADSAARKAQFAVIERLVENATAATATALDPHSKGEALLRLLHAGPMNAGYELHQTDVSKILETGRFNCVSSAVLYNIVGRRLGLDLRGIEVPEHAFSILYDGPRHVDIETTIPEGFNPARSPEAAAKLVARTGFSYVPESHREERREVNDAGLVAIIYFNHGVTLSEQGRYPAALAMYFRGLRLDPESAALVRSALAALTGWSKTEVDAGRFDVARGVLLAGLMLTPDDSTLRRNVPFVCQEQLKAVAARDGDEAARVVAGEAMTSCPEPLRSDVAEVIENHVVRRSSDLIKAGESAAALDLLLQWRSVVPHPHDIDEQSLFALQELLAATTTNPDAEAAALADAVRRNGEFGSRSDARDVVCRHLHLRVDDLRKRGRRVDAEAYVRRHVATIAPLGERCVSDFRERLHAPGADDATDDSGAATAPLQR